MKVMKSMKKLKFWSRKEKKKKKKLNFTENPPSNCHCYCQIPQFQPSAPPLPQSWPYYEQTHVANFAAEVSSYTYSEFPSSSEAQFAFAPQENEEIAPEMKPLLPALPVSPTSTCSYQQYLDPNPVYGMPVVPPARRDRSAVAHLIRCFCPCFRIQEAHLS